MTRFGDWLREQLRAIEARFSQPLFVPWWEYEAIREERDYLLREVEEQQELLRACADLIRIREVIG